MQLSVTRIGDIVRQTEGVIKADRQAKTSETRRTATLMQNAMRKVIAAQLGEPAANTLRKLDFPASGISGDPASSLFSKFVYKRPGGLVDLLTVFRLGATVDARSGDLFVGRRLAKPKGSKIGARRIGRVTHVVVPAELQQLDGIYDRINARLPDAIVRTRDRLIERLAD